jgi:hypothetical protein
VGVEVVPVDAGTHDSLTPTTPAVTGREICDKGVPGGTFTVNDKCPPPTNVTVITQESAEAVGIAARPSVASAATTPTTSFRLLNTVVSLLPPFCRASRGRRAGMAAFEGRYWLTPLFATVNCSFGTCRVDPRLQVPHLHEILWASGPSAARVTATSIGAPAGEL